MATTSLWAAGTSNDGNYASLLTLATTELNTLTSGSYVISSVGGSSGVFSNSNTGQALFGIPTFTFGGTITPASPFNVSCWFAQTADGTTFEDASNLLARAPDFIFAFSANSYASKTVIAPRVVVPALKFKLITQNNVGGSLPSSGNIIKLALNTPIQQ